MATVSMDTLSDNGIIFIRDVLRQNLTDTQSPARAGTSWIFKSMPEDKDFDPPIVVCDESNSDTSILAQGRKKSSPLLTHRIVVWARNIGDRDDITNQISNTLSDRTSTDGTNSIASQNLILKRIRKTNDDEPSLGRDNKIMRVKTLNFDWRYAGA